ncbi:AAT family amino acid transporter, variant [Massarina eburnea CBS 473.64]|uniref:AAT family amino acid transporter, variant n=1 Tax=Massarina eburnea CBS 473.64 TaxID=1395130 RepID=A0A6A6RVQ2_9PLEO|nr:AAT family amino acid transporter, variant [Massarina eburnea CBS 473.64]
MSDISSSSALDRTNPGPNKAVFDYGTTEEDLENNTPVRDVSGDILDDGLRRGLKGRHLVIIALGSIIGPGTYWGIGYAIFLSGPLGALLGFVVVGISMWFLMQSVGEMATLFPVHGGFVEHAGRFVDPALSFSMSWLYYLMWSAFLASDWNSAVLTLRFWISDDTMPSWAWSIIFFAVFTVMTLLGVRAYGEIEHYFGMFKFFGSLIILFMLSIVSNAGGFGGGYTGFKYWQKPTGPIINGIDGFGQVFVLAAAYYVGTEIISLAGGESKNPKRDIPRAINSIVYRILVVYIGMPFFQGLICPSDSPDLLNATSKTALSPFTIGFVNDGWKSAGHFVNALILVAFVSAANGVVYVQSRTVYSLALTNRAPRIFAKTTSRGVPWVAIVTSNFWGFLCLMNRRLSAGQVFSYMTSVGGTAAYIAWASITFTHLWIRAAANKQGIDVKTFPYKAWGSIWCYRFNFAFNIFLLFIQGYTVFRHPFDCKNFIACYITIPTFLLLFFRYKFYFKTTWYRYTPGFCGLSDRREWVAGASGSRNVKRSLKRKVLDLRKDWNVGSV